MLNPKKYFNLNLAVAPNPLKEYLVSSLKCTNEILEIYGIF